MKLINTAQAGEILKCTPIRVRTLCHQGYLKDHNGVDPNHKRHHHKVDVAEVKEFKKKYILLKPRGVQFRIVAENNTQPVLNLDYTSKLPTPVLTEQGKQAFVNQWNPACEEQADARMNRKPIQSFKQELAAINQKLDKLLKLWE